MADSLTKQIARIIDPTSFAMTPEHYGLKTDAEFKTTMASALQSIALEKAQKILRVVNGARKR